MVHFIGTEAMNWECCGGPFDCQRSCEQRESLGMEANHFVLAKYTEALVEYKEQRALGVEYM